MGTEVFPISAGIKNLMEIEHAGAFASTSGWSIHVGAAPNAPDQTITIVDTGGLEPNPKYLLDFPSVQVIVRGAKGGYLDAYRKARHVKDILLGIDATELNGDRWDGITMLGDINSIGMDDSERPMFSLNFNLIVEPQATASTKRSSL